MGFYRTIFFLHILSVAHLASQTLALNYVELSFLKQVPSLHLSHERSGYYQM